MKRLLHSQFISVRTPGTSGKGRKLSVKKSNDSGAEDSVGPHSGRPVLLRPTMKIEGMDSLFPFLTNWEAHIIQLNFFLVQQNKKSIKIQKRKCVNLFKVQVMSFSQCRNNRNMIFFFKTGKNVQVQLISFYCINVETIEK